MAKSAYLCVISLAIGAFGGWALRGADTTGTVTETAAVSTVSPFNAPIQRQASAAIDMTQIRAVLREELAVALAQQGNGQAAVQTAAPPPPASPELLAQRREAVQDIEAMVAGGRWGNDERAAFQQRLTLLDPQQAERVLMQVTRALNEGTIQVTTNGPPL
jgi:hypothetical protein